MWRHRKLLHRNTLRRDADGRWRRASAETAADAIENALCATPIGLRKDRVCALKSPYYAQSHAGKHTGHT